MAEVSPTIRVEFYGIARQRAGTETAIIPLESPAMDLGELIRELTLRFPRMATECFDRGGLRAGYVANIDGNQFVSDPHTLLPAGASVLLLSADAGG